MTPKSQGLTTSHHRLRPDTRLLLRYAVASRLLVLSLIIICRSFLSPYGTSASINPPCLSSSNSSNPPPPVLLPGVGSAIEGSIVWDGVYLIRIAECGYEYEQTYAFLPLLPLCVSLLSKTFFAPLVPVIGYRAVLGLSGYVLNNIAFVFASLYLYRLSVIVLKDNKEVALRASVLFCFNPASIFYSSIYSESLYAFLPFGGFYYFMNSTNFCATFWLALSGCARSNGVLNAGYICFHSMQQVNEAFISRKRSYLLMAKTLLAGALCSMCIFTPFISFQAYGYFNICMSRSVAEMRPWCKARLPILYNYIQSHYWGVGFLRYFQVKQLPNFLLACSIAYYVKLWPGVFLSHGLRVSSIEDELAASPLSTRAEGLLSTTGFSEDDTPNVLQDDRALGLRKRERAIKREYSVMQPSTSETPDSPQYDPVVILPFVLQMSFMVATSLFVMHVQGIQVVLNQQTEKPIDSKSKPLLEEVILKGVASGNNPGGAKVWMCKHCKAEYKSTYTRIHAHFFGVAVGKKIDIRRCPALLKNRAEFERIRKKVENAEKQGVSSSLKNSKLTRRFVPKSTGSLEESFALMDRHAVDAAIVSALCANGIPFNVLRNPQFCRMVTAINKGPKGYKAPSFEKARTTLLDEVKTSVEKELISVKDTWHTDGVSIVSDG